MSNNKQSSDFNMSELGSTLPAAAAALSAEDRAGLVNALKNKLQHLAGQHTDVLETLSPKVRKRVEVLREIQSQHDELEAKFFEERAALEAKYQKLYEPLYTKRYDIVNGVVEVEGVTNDAAEEAAAEDKATEEKGVPDFWLNAMKTNEVLAEEISERDEGALKYLKDIKWCRINDPKGFKLDFFFDPNPYLKNSVLTKTYHMIDDDEPILEKAIGTEIEWYPGKSLTQKLLKKKPRKGSKNTKPITKTENCDSFFNFFNPPQVPEDDDDIDEETAEQLQNQMEQDYDIGSTIRDKIIPHAVSWFTGEAVQGEDFEDIGEDDDEDEDGEEDEDEDEEDEDDDEDDEDEDEGKSRKKVTPRCPPTYFMCLRWNGTIVSAKCLTDSVCENTTVYTRTYHATLQPKGSDADRYYPYTEVYRSTRTLNCYIESFTGTLDSTKSSDATRPLAALSVGLAILLAFLAYP